MKRLTLEEFVESKYAEEIHRSFIEDSIICKLRNEMLCFANTHLHPVRYEPIPWIGELTDYEKLMDNYEVAIKIRESDIKKHLIGSKLNSDMAVRAEYMEYINENFTDSESLKAMAWMLCGEAAIRISECQPFADVSIQPKFNIADKHPKEFVFRDGRMEDIIRELGSPVAECQLKRMIEKDESAYESN